MPLIRSRQGQELDGSGLVLNVTRKPQYRVAVTLAQGCATEMGGVAQELDRIRPVAGTAIYSDDSRPTRLAAPCGS